VFLFRRRSPLVADRNGGTVQVIRDAEKIVEAFFNRMIDKAGPGTTAMLQTAKGVAGLLVGVVKERVRQAIEGGYYVEAVEWLRSAVKGLVVAELPAWVRWLPFGNPGRWVDRLADWLVENQESIGEAVGAKV